MLTISPLEMIDHLVDDPTRRQIAADEWVEKLCDLIRRWQPQCWGVESGQIKSGIGPYLRKRMIERSAYCRLKELVTTLFRVANCCCRGSPSEMKPDSTCSLRTFQIPRFAKCDGFTVPVKIALGVLESSSAGCSDPWWRRREWRRFWGGRR